MSSSYLADIILPDAPAVPVPEPEPDTEAPESHDAIVERAPDAEQALAEDEDEVLGGDEDDDDVLPDPPVKKPKLLKEDIFKKKPLPEVLTVNPEDDDLINEILSAPPAPLAKAKKPKRKATEAQLAALARGRETARIKKEGQASEKNKIKEEKLILRKQRAALREEAEVKKEQRKLRPLPPKQESFSKADMLEATEQALQKFETKRKAEKVEKKKAQLAAQHDAKVYKDINNAIGIRDDDPWAQCFSFS